MSLQAKLDAFEADFEAGKPPYNVSREAPRRSGHSGGDGRRCAAHSGEHESSDRP
jgi:hypothetical protein